MRGFNVVWLERNDFSLYFACQVLPLTVLMRLSRAHMGTHGASTRQRAETLVSTLLTFYPEHIKYTAYAENRPVNTPALQGLNCERR